MTALPDDYTPPPRSLLYVKPHEDENGQGFEAACDCGAVTCIVVVDAHLLTEPKEVAFTCDGCNSVTWFKVGPAGEVTS